MQEAVRFVFDDCIVSVDFSESSGIRPSTTVLNYLRSLIDHKGAKEGCAEGDCGACTVVLAEVGDHGKLVYRTIDSCLVFLPMIHGKQLITVENLAFFKEKHKVLHPVQEMMVKTNGSQCGYCTPGMVMSLFGLFKNHQNPSREIIEDALTGNLCRCTGYQSILEAARETCSGNGTDHFSQYESGVIGMLNEITANTRTREFRKGKQYYIKPFTLSEALKARKEYPSATLINGSTDVALRQTKKKELLTGLIDLSDVKELRHFSEDQNGYTFGAGLPMEKVRLFAKGKLPALCGILKVFGSLQIRNMATLGGNVASASPIGDTLPLLFAYKAMIIIRSHEAERTIGIENFILGYRKTSLGADELITGIIIPKYETNTRISAYKVSKREDMDISTVSAAFRLELSRGYVDEVILAYGGMASAPVRAINTEKFLKGKTWSRETVELAMTMLSNEFNPISDARAEAGYRTAIAKNLLLKFFIETTLPQTTSFPGD